MATRTHIVIVEPSAILRYGLASMLQQTAHTTTIEVGDVAAISATNTKPADVVIINPIYLGAYSLDQLRAEAGNDNAKVVALLSTLIDQDALANFDDTISIYDSEQTITKKITSIATRDNDATAKKELSTREKEIIVCVVKGQTNKQIAQTLFLSTHTVIAHRRNIANKLQIHSPAGLTIYAIVNKLVNIADVKNSISKEDSDESI